MSEILAITAFLMAFGAVFLANDAIRKAEHKNEAFIKKHVDKLTADIGQNKTLIIEQRLALEAHTEQLQESSDERLEIKKQIAALEEQLATANAEIDEQNTAVKKKSPRKST